jgi:5-methylcytosine-specific restriction endonuclease McrA
MFRFCVICQAVVEAFDYRKHMTAHRNQQRERPGSTSAWRSLRRQVLARDGHRCVICGKTTELEVHHRDSNWRHNELSNLEVRCLEHNRPGRPPAA